MLDRFVQQHGLPSQYAEIAQKWFIPLCDDINHCLTSSSAPLMLGINGCQGSGKSTLVKFIADYLTTEYDLSVITMSLDDFYLDQEQRSQLASQVHPLLSTRGVPGTHNYQQLNTVLHALKQGSATIIPQFDKATDNPKPQNQWLTVNRQIDIVIVEGWCWGAYPQSASQLPTPVNDLEKLRDQSYVWREYVNQQLDSHFVPLYQLMDHWLMLKAPSFDCVASWRWQQEQMLVQSLQGQLPQSLLMSKQQVEHFVSYFQRLTEHCIETLPEKCDVVFELDNQRNIERQLGRFSL